MDDQDKAERDKFIGLQSESRPNKKDQDWKPFWVRLKSEPYYRQQFLDTACIWAGFFVFGFVYGQPGPTLPDIRIITGVALGPASWFFTSFSFGYLFGCLITGFIETKINLRLFLFVCLFGTAVFTTVTPWCKYFELVLAARVCMGLFVGGIDTGGHTFIFSIWRTDVHTYVQIMYFLFASGGLLVPLATTPFLWHPPSNTDNPLYNGNNYINYTDCTNCTVPEFTLDGSNGTKLLNDSACKNCTQPLSIAVTTRVHYSFLISGVICFAASIPFLIMYTRKRNHRYEIDENTDTVGDVNQKESKIKYVIAVILLTLLFGIITGWIDSFAGFLMSFSIRHLKWSKPQGSLVTTIFWVTYAIGNLMCVFLVQCFRTGTLLFSYFMISIAGLAGLIAASIYVAPAPVWVSVSLTGFSMSIMWPGVFTWTEETVTPVTGKIASLFLVAGAVGFMVNPLLTGYTMDNFTNLSYCYVHFGEALLLTSIFVTVSIMYWNSTKTEEKEKETDKADVEMDLIKRSEVRQSDEMTDGYTRD